MAMLISAGANNFDFLSTHSGSLFKNVPGTEND